MNKPTSGNLRSRTLPIHIIFAVLIALSSAVNSAAAQTDIKQTPAPRPAFPFKIYILLYEGIDPAPFAQLIPELERTFDFPVEILTERPAPPEKLLDKNRKQYPATAILDHALAQAPPDAARIIAFFPGDIFIGRARWNFGLADPDGRGAVISTARLQSGEPKRYFARILKLSRHELAHTFGVAHCTQEPQNCIMHQMSEVMQLDGQSASFCGYCQARLIKNIRKEKERLLTSYH